MEKNENTEDGVLDEVIDTEESSESEEQSVDWKALALKNQGIAKRLKTKLDDFKQQGVKEGGEQEKEQKTDNNSEVLLQKAFLRSAGINKKDEVEMALKKAKKWGMDIDELVDDEDFLAQLEKHRTTQANIKATTGVDGANNNTNSVKNNVDYWKAKGVPPTPEDVPDRATRTKIINQMLKLSSSNGKKFYND